MGEIPAFAGMTGKGRRNDRLDIYSSDDCQSLCENIASGRIELIQEN